MLSKLNIPTSEKRRKIASLIVMLYKIIYKKLVYISLSSYIKPSKTHKYSIPNSRVNPNKNILP